MWLLNKYITSLSETKRKVFLNVCWAILGKIVNMFGVLILGIIIARYLGPEQYGLMNYVISYVTIFSVIAGFGLENIEIRELSKNPERKEFILGTAFITRLIFSAIGLLLILLSIFVYKTNSKTTIFIIIYSISIFSGSFNVIRNYFTSEVRNEYVVKSEIARTFIGAVIKVALLLLGFPLIFFIIAMTLDPILVASGYIISYNKKVGRVRDWKYDPIFLKYLLKEAFPLFLSSAAVVLYQKIDQIMIKNMIDNKALGFFSVALQLVNVIMILPVILVQTITPILVRLRQNDIMRYEEKKQQFVSVVVWISIIISGIVSIGAYWIVYFLYGIVFLKAVPVLQIMSWKAVGMALTASSGQIIIMEYLQKWVFVRNFLTVGVCICTNLLLIPAYGIIGSAWASIITAFFTAFFANILIKPYHNIMRIQLKSLILGWREIIKIKKLWI